MLRRRWAMTALRENARLKLERLEYCMSVVVLLLPLREELRRLARSWHAELLALSGVVRAFQAFTVIYSTAVRLSQFFIDSRRFRRN